VREAVRHTPELDRILSLPRRTWEQGADELARALSELLRTDRNCAECGGRFEHASGCKSRSIPLSLRPVQAVGLYEVVAQQGFLGPISVGKGKTLLSLLMAYVLESVRPLLVLPANLIEKTRREWRTLAIYWKIPNWIRIQSYQLLGRVQAKEELERFQPDLIVFDEAHKVKNRKAAVTIRFKRYIEARRAAEADAPNLPRLRVAAMSGTITSKSIKEFAHVMQWCLPHHACVPWSWVECETWARALDELVTPTTRIDPGALLAFCDERENDAPDGTTAARRGFQRRLTETPGVVATTDAPLGASLQINELPEVPSPAIDEAFRTLRTKWELPDGWELIDGAAVWRHARELVLGFFYVWDPRPPREWLEARATWASFAREVIKRGKYDSEHDVALHFSSSDEYRAWKEIRDTFVPNQKAVWICDSMIRTCAAWLDEHERGICWTEHVAFAEELSRYSGRPYFGRMGRDARGRYIEDVEGPVIASWDANREGRNLQFKWSDNLFTACSSDGAENEQGLGRTHRDGQPEDTVTADIYFGCAEHAGGFWRAVDRARFFQDTTGQAQKLCYADITISTLDEVALRHGSRWLR
jgi:hypothetical protein